MHQIKECNLSRVEMGLIGFDLSEQSSADLRLVNSKVVVLYDKFTIWIGLDGLSLMIQEVEAEREKLWFGAKN